MKKIISDNKLNEEEWVKTKTERRQRNEEDIKEVLERVLEIRQKS